MNTKKNMEILNPAGAQAPAGKGEDSLNLDRPGSFEPAPHDFKKPATKDARSLKTSTLRTSICQGVIALGLLLTVTSALALAPTAPAGGSTPAAEALPAQTTLAPAAPMASPVHSAGEDIRDIRQPRRNPAPWLWVGIPAGVIAFVVMGFALRWWIYHGKFFQMRPHEIALQYLEEVRPLLDPDRTREYCVESSKILRRYLEERFHVQAPQLTTEEFLHQMAESSEALPAPRRARLADFLQHYDLARFAGWYYCRPDLEAMHLSAVEFVRQTAANGPDMDRNRDSGAADETSRTLQRERRNGSNPLTI